MEITKKKLKFFNNMKGVTLIALVITIIILLILVGISIITMTGENGLLKKSIMAKEESNKQAATEIINLKITTSQIDIYGKEQRMPTLKELSLSLGKDNEIEYVTESSKLSSIEYNVNSDNPSTIYTKLKEYPYEFEINSSLQLASIDGEEIIKNNDGSNNSDEIKELKATISQMQTTINLLDTRLTNLTSMYDNIKIKNYKSGTTDIPACPIKTNISTYVSFSEPLQDTNYAVLILSTYHGPWWAQSSYSVSEKTVNGFTIWCYNTGDASTNAHPVDWLIVPKTQ